MQRPSTETQSNPPQTILEGLPESRLGALREDFGVQPQQALP